MFILVFIMNAIMMVLGVVIAAKPEAVFRLLTRWYGVMGVDVSKVITSEERVIRVIRFTGFFIVAIDIVSVVVTVVLLRAISGLGVGL